MQTLLSITENVDLRAYPFITPRPEMTDLTMGDIHANVLYLLNILVREGVVEIPKEQYSQFATLYNNPLINPELIRFHVKPAKIFNQEHDKDRVEILNAIRNEFDNLLKSIKVIDPKKKIRLIGDELVDRSVNDYFMLAFLNHLENEQANFEILLSNHGIEFVEACERYKEKGNKLIAQRLDNTDHGNSFYALQETIKAGVVSNEEVLNIYNKVYKKHLKILSYSLDTDSNEIHIYSHAAIGFSHIKGLAKKLNVKYSDKNAAELAKTIDSMNHTFNDLAKKGQIHTLFTDKIMSQGYRGEKLNSTDEVVAALVWNRAYTDLDRESPNFKAVFIHGHDSHDPSDKHITLNERIGQFSNYVGNIVLYLTNGKQVSPKKEATILTDFPASYTNIWSQNDNLDSLMKAKELLKDYTKENCLLGGLLGRFFSTHWNRHHTKQVSQIIKEYDNLNEMITALKLVHPREGGSLDKRIRFIETHAVKSDITPSITATR